jgi:hypothetical protein
MRELENYVSTAGEANSMTLEDQIAAFDPTNPESLAALEKSVLGVAVETSVDPDPMNGSGLKSASDEVQAAADKQEGAAKQDEKKTEEPAPASATQVAGDPSVTPEPKGVQAKDGQHIIPYSVLERERDRAARAEQTAQALADQLKQLQAGNKGASPADANAGGLTDEDLQTLDRDQPEVAKLIRSQMAAVEQLTGVVRSLQQEQEVAYQTKAASVQDEIEAAVTANADLKSWRDAAFSKEAPNPLMWNRAADLDAVLREDPAWQDKPVAERFAKVAETMRTIYSVPSVTPSKTTTPPDVKQVADAQLKAAPAVVPTTLSDIPGGAPPAQSDAETLENASAISLGNKFLTMTPEQIESYLSRMAA